MKGSAEQRWQWQKTFGHQNRKKEKEKRKRRGRRELLSSGPSGFQKAEESKAKRGADMHGRIVISLCRSAIVLIIPDNEVQGRLTYRG
jgi:hypothetical protein